MKNKCGLLLSMVFVSLLSLIFMLSLSPTMAQEMEELPLVELDKDQNRLTTYIVHVTKPMGGGTMLSEDLDNWYRSFLPYTITSSNHHPRMVYSFKNVATGFAARLTDEEVKAMKGKDGFISARPERILPLHTTHSPNFLGLYQNLGFWKDSNFGKGVINWSSRHWHISESSFI